MRLYNTIKRFLKEGVNTEKQIAINNEEQYQYNYIASELIRNTHSIEKGLSIESPRLGFGHDKQRDMMEQIKSLYKIDNPYFKEVCQMAIDALNAYLEYHIQKDYSDEMCMQIQMFLKQYTVSTKVKKGGVQILKKEDLVFTISEIEKFIKTRHSIRDFSETPVDSNLLLKAVRLAQKAPSACNRQGVRVYILSEEKSKFLSQTLAGIGGFADKAGRYILITGKLSSYRQSEINQYIVSASIYVGYLSLTLHLYGLGACVIQRPVIWNKNWDILREELKIEKDEQLVCALAVGNLKEECFVPISYRLSESVFCHFIN